MDRLWKLLADSPGVVAQLVLAIVAVLGSFGLLISDVQSGAIVGVVMAVSAVVAALIGRKKTVPVNRVLSYKKTDGTVHKKY